jgi:two-component system chemotaxis family response regulator WspR
MSLSASAPLDPTTVHVLLVDDQPLLGEAVRRMLVEQLPGVRYSYCRRYEDALLTACDAAPTVILQDLIMGEHDGLSLVAAYRQQPVLADVPVVVLSASEDAETKAQAFQLGANDYVVKLPSALELAARVRYHSQACIYARERAEAFRALLESQAALRARAAEIEAQRQQLAAQAAQLAQANHELHESAYSDPLTGLRNRRWFRQHVEPRLLGWRLTSERPARHTGDHCVLMLLDIDHFKAINDRLGHDGGDDVLIVVGERLRQCLRGGDEVIRWGGEEFLLALVGSTTRDAEALAARVLSTLAGKPIETRNGTLRVTASLGWAVYPFFEEAAERMSLERVMALADAGAYLSKRGGRNQAHGVLPGPMPLDPARIASSEDAPALLAAEDGRSVRLVRVPGLASEVSA